MKKAVVAIAKDPDVRKMVAEVFSLLGGLESLIRSGSTVVIKPNAGHLGGPETSVNTNPELVAAIIETVRAAKPKKIILAEASAIGCDTMECFKSSGILDAAVKAGVDEVIDIKKEKDLLDIPIRDAKSDLKKVKLPRFLVEAEHIINVPIFKSHASMVFTNALKNIKGVVQDKVHYQMHQTSLAMAMMDLWSVVRADLTVADMIRPAEGFGPHTTVPLDFGCVVAGRDPVAVDATACRMVGLDINRVPYFEAAAERGLGVFDEDKIEVRGRSIEEVYQKMWLPYLDGFETWPEYRFYPENSCSSCQSLVALTMEKLKSLGEYEKNTDAVIVLGRKKQLPEGVDPKSLILVGNCLKNHRKKGIWVEGCPPGEPTPLWAIVDRREQAEIIEGARERMAAEEKLWREYVDRLVAEKRSRSRLNL